MDKPWKERIIDTRNASLTARGVVLPKDETERKQFLKAVDDRGGIVAVELPSIEGPEKGKKVKDVIV